MVLSRHVRPPHLARSYLTLLLLPNHPRVRLVATMASLRTPSPALPAGDNGRFVDTSSPCEWAEEYRPGGFHPVDIGDSLGKDGRYRVIRKLGYGSFSIVWLTVDQ